MHLPIVIQLLVSIEVQRLQLFFNSAFLSLPLSIFHLCSRAKATSTTAKGGEARSEAGASRQTTERGAGLTDRGMKSLSSRALQSRQCCHYVENHRQQIVYLFAFVSICVLLFTERFYSRRKAYFRSSVNVNVNQSNSVLMQSEALVPYFIPRRMQRRRKKLHPQLLLPSVHLRNDTRTRLFIEVCPFIIIIDCLF